MLLDQIVNSFKFIEGMGSTIRKLGKSWTKDLKSWITVAQCS